MRTHYLDFGLLYRLRRFALRFFRNENGHITIMFAIGMLFTASLVFFVIAVGKRYLQKETVQAAADSAAFAAAAAEAKVFNTLSFINIVLSIGVAMVYTLHAIFGGITAFVAEVGGGAVLTAGVECLFAEDVCAFAAGPGEILAAKYEKAAEDLTERLRPLARAGEQVARLGPAYIALEATEAGMHDAYKKREPGLLAVLKPPIERLPVQPGPANTVCGNALIQAATGAVVFGEGLLRLPPELTPDVRAGVAVNATAAEVASALIVCEAGTTGLVPQELTPDWPKQSKLAAIAYQGDARVKNRRAFLEMSASEFSRAKDAPANYVIATALAGVYGFDGKDTEDLWHMGWRGRLILSQPSDFNLPLGDLLKRVWVH